ncbi:MAG: hypothetical protein KC684_06720 [Candidatus Omnitrophica bacterium]|nr:hypothetical protein [Candidatus Omnitrophota bacterium]MCA9406208.1 hypothetical protein [Candidatus Omnitrophota bacterium]
MKIGENDVNIFKVRNRRGYAAVCKDCLTEGDTKEEAYERMVKAIRRVERKILNKD